MRSVAALISPARSIIEDGLRKLHEKLQKFVRLFCPFCNSARVYGDDRRTGVYGFNRGAIQKELPTYSSLY